MDLTRNDFAIMVSMTLAVILIVIVSNGMGLTDTGQNKSKMPEYELQANKFDVVGGFPDNPGTPSKGSLTWYESDERSGLETHILWIKGDTSGGVEMFIYNDSINKSSVTWIVNKWSNGNVEYRDEYQLNGSEDLAVHNNNSWSISMETTDIKNIDSTNTTINAEYEIVQRPSDTGFLKSVPIVGSMLQAGDELAGFVGWIGSIIYWFFGSSYEIIVNSIVVILDSAFYAADLFGWMTGQYFAIMDNAGGIASIFVVIPPILMFLESLKIGFIVIHIVWIG